MSDPFDMKRSGPPSPGDDGVLSLRNTGVGLALDDSDADPSPRDADVELVLDDSHVRGVRTVVAQAAAADTGVLRVATLNVSQGLQRKLHLLLPWATSADFHVLAVQEAGLCVPSSIVQACNFNMFIAPHAHAGCALFVSAALMPCVERSHESAGGRANAVVLVTGGSTTMIVNVYMPTNLDRVPEDSATALECVAVYDEVLRWADLLPIDARVVIMGDFNETISPRDRSEHRRGVRRNRFVRQLADAGYVDAFRACVARHDDDGWTCFTPLSHSEVAAARLDQIWCQGFPDNFVLDASVVAAPIRTSHRAVAAELRSSLVAIDHHQQALRSLPDMRKATDEQRERSVAIMHAWAAGSGINKQLEAATVADLDRVTEQLIAAAHRACVPLPRTHRRPFMSTTRVDLAKRCGRLRRLRTLLRLPDEHFSPELLPHLVQACGRDLDSCYESLGYVIDDRAQWNEAVGRRLNELRRAEREEVKRMRAAPRDSDPWNKNPAAFVRQMLHGERAGPLASVIDPEDGCLKVSPDDVKRVLHTHYTRVFAATSRTAARPAWVESQYAPRKNIDPRWYDGLMEKVAPDEIKCAIADADYVTAAGVDDISAGVWKLLCQSENVRDTLARYVSAVLRVHVMPSVGKRSVIVPISKKVNGGKGLDNVRPISLQCALTKLITKILATRLGSMLAKNRILHSAQEGFLPGGQSAACIDVLLDIVEQTHEASEPLHMIFYDLMQAYDTMRHDDLLLSLRRLRLPTAFIDFIEDSMSGLVSSVRCAHGTTADIAVRRSVRQGDPLAPLLFVCFLDSLHSGLHSNPLYGHICDGMRVSRTTAAVASKGFADDTVVLSASMNGLRRLHHWACVWVRWHCMRFHVKKTVLISQTAGGEIIANHHIRIDGHVLVPAPPSAAVGYLGALLRLDLRADVQSADIAQRIGRFCAALRRHQLRVDRAIFAVNTFLIPSLAYAMAFVQPSKREASGWDKQVALAVMNLCGDDVVRRMKPEALAAITGLVLPSYHEQVIKISETYIRLNSECAAGLSARARWDKLHRGSATSNRLRRVLTCAATFGLELTRTAKRARLWHDSPRLPAAARVLNFEVDGHPCSAVQDVYGCWGSDTSGWPAITMCTDGSVQGKGPFEASGWAVFFLDDWFAANWATIPAEGQFNAGTLQGATYMHGRVPMSHGAGVFDAELQAIARGLGAVPITCDVTIYTDCDSAIAAQNRYDSAIGERALLRTSGRQWLSLICRLCRRRAEAGASTQFLWVGAHSDLKSRAHVGNRIADELAKRASAIGAAPPRGAQLPLEQEDVWLSMYHLDVDTGQRGRLATGDPRKVCIRRARECALAEWRASATQSTFSHPDAGYEELWLCIRTLRPVLASEVLLFLTDTCHWRRAADGSVGAAHCNPCNVTCNVSHLMCCPALQRRRADAALSVCDVLEDAHWRPSAPLRAACQRWRAMRPLDVRTMLVHLRLASGDAASGGVIAAAFGAFRADAAHAFQRVWKVEPEHLDRLRCALFVAASRSWVNRAR
ncbi:MAG: reverse transcriptase domain-containing protein [Pseudomonadota bacterium]|nr:reverse transcriptase domain-containing protein [Pseudomonadota bacterium]